MGKLDLERFDFIATLLLTLGWFAVLTVILVGGMHRLYSELNIIYNQTTNITNQLNQFKGECITTTNQTYTCYDYLQDLDLFLNTHKLNKTK